MELFDAFFSIGKTNTMAADLPGDENQALALMDKVGIAEAMVYHTVARDSDPELGNAQLANLKSERLHKVWAYDPTCIIPETPAQFLKRAQNAGAEAILINPLSRGLRIDRTIRILEIAKLLEKHQIPLLLTYRTFNAGADDIIDWYQLADFCNKFPKLKVLAYEWRMHSNRPMLDALALTKNLYLPISSIWQAQMTEAICESLGPRLVFSAGLPMLDPLSFVGTIHYADISEKHRQAIAFGNIRSFLNKAKKNV